MDFDSNVEDDDAIIKQRKKEEKEFVKTYNRFIGIVNQMNSCRNAAQDRIVSRLATNPTVASSNQLFIAKVRPHTHHILNWVHSLNLELLI